MLAEVEDLLPNHAEDGASGQEAPTGCGRAPLRQKNERDGEVAATYRAPDRSGPRVVQPVVVHNRGELY